MFARSPRSLSTAGSLNDCCPRLRERPQRKGRPRERPSYFVWQEGKPPDVMWEFGAPQPVEGDAEKKKEMYPGDGSA